MQKHRLLLLAAFPMLCCQHAPPARVAIHYPPSVTERWEQAYVDVVTEEVLAEGKKMCNLDPHLFCAWVSVTPGPFLCGEVVAAGCYPVSGICIMHVKFVDPVWESALVHEMLHHVYWLCSKDDGGLIAHSEEFYESVSVVTSRVKKRITGEE